MEKRIALECGNLQKSEVINLNLDHCKSSSLSGLTKEFVSLETLSLINNGLTSLQGFPSLPKLRKLELADNFLCGGFENLEGCTSLQKINLSGNKIKDIDCLKPLRNLPNLVSLDLFSNDVTSSESFPDNVKSLLPNVQSFCEDELEGLSSSGGEDDLAEGDEDDYEDDEEEGGEDSEGEEGQRDSSQQASMSSSGGKSGPSSIPVNATQVKNTNGEVDGEASDYSDEEGASDEDSEFDDDEGAEDDEEEYEEGPGLEYLYQNHLQDNDEDDQEFEAGDGRVEGDSEEEDENEDGQSGPTPAKQAKHDHDDHLLPGAAASSSSQFALHEDDDEEDADQGHKEDEEDYLGDDVSNTSPPPQPPFDELEEDDDDNS